VFPSYLQFNKAVAINRRVLTTLLEYHSRSAVSRSVQLPNSGSPFVSILRCGVDVSTKNADEIHPNRLKTLRDDPAKINEARKSSKKYGTSHAISLLRAGMENVFGECEVRFYGKFHFVNAP
jgi:hypothetical protein